MYLGNVNNFLLSLATAMAGLATPAVALGGLSGAAAIDDAQLYVLEAVEPATPTLGLQGRPAYAVLRPYGGPAASPLHLPAAELSIQCMSYHQRLAKALELGGRMYETLFLAAPIVQPRHNWTIDGKMFDATGAVVADGVAGDGAGHWKILVIKPGGPPAGIGNDGVRNQASFNFNVRMVN